MNHYCFIWNEIKLDDKHFKLSYTYFGDNMNYMELADLEARENFKNNFMDGGPFGAVIVKDGQVIAKAHNHVLKDNDPTSHAEINAIREACRNLKTHDLTDCILYSSCEPCPMCLSASVWANIKEINYGNSRLDADEIGFRDNYIYDVIREYPITRYPVKQIDHDKTIGTFHEFRDNQNKTIY